MSLYDRVTLTEGKKLGKTEQMIMARLAKDGVFKHEAGSGRRGVARYTKSYPFGLRVEAAIRKLTKRGLVELRVETWHQQGEASRISIVTLKKEK